MSGQSPADVTHSIRWHRVASFIRHGNSNQTSGINNLDLTIRLRHRCTLMEDQLIGSPSPVRAFHILLATRKERAVFLNLAALLVKGTNFLSFGRRGPSNSINMRLVNQSQSV